MRYSKIYLFLLIALSSQILVSQEQVEDGESPSTVEQLLELVKEGQVREQSQNAIREAEFLANKERQASILAAEKRELANQERIADELEAEYDANEEIIRVKEEAYKKELGSLIELFGHLQSAAGEAAVQFSGSLTEAEFGFTDRVSYLNNLTTKMSDTTELPTIDEINRLGYELLNEIAAGGQITTFETSVIDVDGETTICNVVRVGLFNAVCDGKYLEFASSKGQYAFLPRQPEGRYTRSASSVAEANAGEQITFGIDPTGPTGGGSGGSGE